MATPTNPMLAQTKDAYAKEAYDRFQAAQKAVADQQQALADAQSTLKAAGSSPIKQDQAQKAVAAAQKTLVQAQAQQNDAERLYNTRNNEYDSAFNAQNRLDTTQQGQADRYQTQEDRIAIAQSQSAVREGIAGMQAAMATAKAQLDAGRLGLDAYKQQYQEQKDKVDQLLGTFDRQVAAINQAQSTGASLANDANATYRAQLPYMAAPGTQAALNQTLSHLGEKFGLPAPAPLPTMPMPDAGQQTMNYFQQGFNMAKGMGPQFTSPPALPGSVTPSTGGPTSPQDAVTAGQKSAPPAPDIKAIVDAAAGRNAVPRTTNGVNQPPGGGFPAPATTFQPQYSTSEGFNF